MKDQHMKSGKASARRLFPVILLVLLLTIFTAVSVSAESAQNVINIKPEDLTVSGASYADGVYSKEYDGTTGVTVAVKAGLTGSDDVTVTASAAFNSANVSEANEIVVSFTLSGADAYKYAQPATLHLPAKITPVALKWADGASANVSLTYDPAASGYKITTGAIGTLPSLKADPLTTGQTISLTVTDVIALGAVNASATPYTTTAIVTTGNANFTVEPLTVNVTVNPVEITSLVWTGGSNWTYGAKTQIKVTGYDAANNAYDLGYTCADANFAKEIADAGQYTLTVAIPADKATNLKIADATTNQTLTVTVARKAITISFPDASVVGDGKTVYSLTVSGVSDKAVLDLINYQANGAAFAGTSAYGTFTVTAVLPTANYQFNTDAATDVSSLTATLTVLSQTKLVPVVDEKGNVVGNIILAGNDGFDSNAVSATAVAVEGYPALVKNNRYNQVYKIKLTGAAEGQTFSLIIPLTDAVVAPGCKALTLDDLRVADASGKLTAAHKAGLNYTVSLSEGFYRVDGFGGTDEITFVIAPDYSTPFFVTAPGILLIILLIVLLVLILPIIIGLILRRTLDSRQNPVIVIDTDGEQPEPETVEEEESTGPDADEVIDQMIEEAIENAEETTEEDAETQEAVEEALEQVIEEAEAEELEEETTVPEELAETVAEELETEPVEEEAAPEEVEAVVEETMEEAVEEVVEEVVEEPKEEAEETEDESDDGEEDSDESIDALAMVDEDAFGFGNRTADPSTFIDVKEKPEEYQAMLEREERGEIFIVHRYKKSFLAKMAQSMGNVQDYYSEIKNALLGFKGVKCRTSWNYEAFNKGRSHVAKIIAKTKTLYLYLALDPAQLEGTKYNFTDVSDKKKYASTPVLMKIKGDRKFKHALELIEMLLGTQMELPRTNAEKVDYKVERMTVDEMVEAGIIKHLAGYIPLTPDQPDPTDEVTEVSEDAIPADAEVASEDLPADEPAEEATEEPAEEVADDSAADEAAEETSEEAKTDASEEASEN